ncbi:MAG: hypothetical protein WEA54_00795 [Actinomycetota bacterium]
MGQVVRIDEWLQRRGRAGAALSEALARLERTVRRLDPAVRKAAGDDGSVDPRVETELLAITGAVHQGRADEALVRAERLADLLEHPASRRHQR